MHDLWLLKRDISVELPLTSSAMPMPGLQLWRSIEARLDYLYAPRDASTTCPTQDDASPWIPLNCVQDLPGASAGHVVTHHYVVETDVVPEVEDDLVAWYTQEHLPGLASVPGTVRASRYIDREGSPRYYACYDLTGADVLGSPAWLAVRGTDWSSRVRPAFRNTRRTMFVRPDAERS